MKSALKAVITVTGRDMVGIIAKVSSICLENNINILDISQSVLQDLFAMVMLVDISQSKIPFETLVAELDRAGKEFCLDIHTVHEDIFKSMHTI